MKILFRLALICPVLVLAACASNKPKPVKSGWRIIDSDDDHNPFISDNPAHAGEIIKDNTRQ
ncbi:MAG: hypothetical protein QM796_10545 [Chthoniobacteraceae bacterium]